METKNHVYFFRKNGRIRVIRQKKIDVVPVPVGVAGISTAAMGASYYSGREFAQQRAEKAIKNSIGIKQFQNQLKPGDILLMGTTKTHEGALTIKKLAERFPEKLGNKILKFSKKVGLKNDRKILSTATLLIGVGASEKYHTGIYMGNGKVAHVLPGHGTIKESLSIVLQKENATALRFKNASRKEIKSALMFSKKAVEKNLGYQQAGDLAKIASSNLLIPIGAKPKRKLGRLVCTTLPIRGWNQRNFGPLGEHTLPGDFKYVKDLQKIARRDIIKSPIHVLKSYIGIAGRGLKWGLLGAAGAFAVNNIIKFSNVRKESNGTK